MKQCPECGAMSFFVSAHVVQEWLVDANGCFVCSNDDCMEVTHFPTDDDLWECASCGNVAVGTEFNIKD